MPGLGIAIIHRGQVVAVRTYGVLEAGSSTPVDTATLFQVGSISKSVTALAALRLVQQGVIDLDQDVNTVLRRWALHDSAGTVVHLVTPRLLLSHRAGINVHGFPGYAAGAPLPTLLDVLDGLPPANTPPIRVVRPPGVEPQYSGGGYEVLQQLMTDVTGEPFDGLMRRLVFAPLQLPRSTFTAPLPDGLATNAASAHTASGTPVPGGWHTYPEQAAASLWTTPAELATIVVALITARRGAAGSLLQRELAAQMIPAAPGVGLGLFVGGRGDSAYFVHDGAVEGAQAIAVGFPALGMGAVVLANSANGLMLANEILHGIALRYGWPAYRSIVRERLALSPSELGPLGGTYAATVDGTPQSVRLALTGDSLVASSTYWQGTRTVYASPDGTFFTLEGDWSMTFERDSQGRVTRLRFGPVSLGPVAK